MVMLFLFPYSTSQVAALVRIFGGCREDQIPSGQDRIALRQKESYKAEFFKLGKGPW